jgi:hypothetical protein
LPTIQTQQKPYKIQHKTPQTKLHKTKTNIKQKQQKTQTKPTKEKKYFFAKNLQMSG